MDSPAHGLFHPRGWRIDVGSDAGADMTAVASMHEAMHERLQHTTLWGWTVQLYFAFAEAQGDEHDRGTALGMLASSHHVHEQFATWTSMTVGGLTAESLRQQYPVYFWHARRAAALLVGIDSPYLQLHAAQAVARSCMQPANLVTVLSDGLAELRVSQMDRSMRPDFRQAALARRLRAEGWGDIPVRFSSALTLADFAVRDDEGYLETNLWFYDRARALLADEGLPTLELDAHVPHVLAMHRRAQDDAGSSLGYRSFGTPSEDDDLDVIVLAQESETLILGAPLPAVVLEAGTDPAVMISGDGSAQHLFLAIRPAARLARQYSLKHTWSGQHVAVLRTVADVDDRRSVVMLDVSNVDPQHLLGYDVPVIVNASMRSMTDEPTASRWRPLMKADSSTVLCDLSPSSHIRDWISTPGCALRYSVAGVQSRVGLVRALVFAMVSGGGKSRTFVALASRTFVRAFDLWVDEHPRFSGRSQRSDELVEAAGQMLEFTLRHLVAEEREFGFDAGDRQWTTHDT